MENPSFHIATLHRGRFMLLLLLGICVITAVVSRFDLTQIVKILMLLVSLPGLLFLSVRASRNSSFWTVANGQVQIRFEKAGEEVISIQDIRYLRNVPRSGGNLIMIFYKKSRSPRRYWRNKLFQKNDDLDRLIHALRQNGVEYYYM